MMPPPRLAAALALALPLALSLALSLAGCATPTNPTLEVRVRALEDQLAIQRVITNYSAFLDRHDYQGYVGLFTPDGVWQNGATVRRGRAEIMAMLTGLLGPPDPAFVNLSSFHQIGNFEIDVDGDTAHARSRFVFVMRGAGGAPTPTLSGRYEDDLVRTPAGWQIARRVDHTIMPTADEWVAELRRRGLATMDEN